MTVSARRFWHLIEPLNAVTYFSPDALQAAADLGLKGFWMGYFGCRAAPLGPVGPGVVEATFYNFHPDRVRRAVPDVWSFAAPAAVLEARAAGSAAALRRLAPALDDVAAEATATLHRLVDHAAPEGRPLFVANRDVPPPSDPVAALWQACTTLREHRGDGHVALLTAAGLDGCEVHVLATSVGRFPPELARAARGWSEPEWADAVARLARRGLVDAEGRATDAGRAEHQRLEDRTDELASAPLAALEAEQAGVLDRLRHLLEPSSRAVVGSGELRFPNPMGLPERDD